MNCAKVWTFVKERKRKIKKQFNFVGINIKSEFMESYIIKMSDIKSKRILHVFESCVMF